MYTYSISKINSERYMYVLIDTKIGKDRIFRQQSTRRSFCRGRENCHCQPTKSCKSV